MIRTNRFYHPLGHCPPKRNPPQPPTTAQRSILFTAIRSIIRETIARIRGPYVTQVGQRHPDFWRERCANCWESHSKCHCQRSDA
jgi:hypothetical protein